MIAIKLSILKGVNFYLNKCDERGILGKPAFIYQLCLVYYLDLGQ